MEMMKSCPVWSRAAAALLVGLVLLGCGGVEPTASITASATATEMPTSTSTATRTATPARPSPTATRVPTMTPPPPTASATRVRPSPEPTPTKTPTATPTVTLAPEDLEELVWSSLSPDGAWTVAGQALLPRAGGEQYYTRLTLRRQDGSLEWTVVDAWSPFGLGYTLPEAVRWSDNGEYFYFTNRPVPDGCALFANGSDLQRVDLSDGSVTELAPSVGTVISLSPDEATLAYVGYGDRGLVLRDLATGEERSVSLESQDNAATGALQWSPEGEALAFTQAYDPCGPPEGRTHSILHLDIASRQVSTLIERDDRLFTTVEWAADGTLWLIDREDQYWRLDPQTGEVSLLPADGIPEQVAIGGGVTTPFPLRFSSCGGL